MINYVSGDATAPRGEGLRLILHVCNNVGAWGAGFTKAVSSRWLEPEREFRNWSRHGTPSRLELGDIQNVNVEQDLWVVNMIAQNGVRHASRPVCIEYGHLQTCLEKVACLWKEWGASVHMPRIGSGLAGGTWDVVEHYIQKTLCAAEMPVTVYILQGWST